MIIIAESGSTKCDWLVLNDDWDVVNHEQTSGYNPYFHDEYFIYGDLKLNTFLNEHKHSINKVWFYGAGCSTNHYSKIVFNGLERFFPNAVIEVEHDLMASALVAYKGEPCISCILGTGSNACYYDGETLTESNPPLGYIVGDEASGCYFGKILLNAYFNKQLPEDLAKAFKETYNLSHAEFTAKTYSSARANVYLASFMEFYSANKQHSYIQLIVKKGFREFIEKHICCFDKYTDIKISFVGSIAYFFQDEIEYVGSEFGLSFGEFFRKPVFKLMEYHKNLEAVKIK